jgi:XapX domain-containing protein
MKLYLVSLGCGLLVGVIYSLLHVRSPAPPVVALVGLLGILIGEQAVPLWRWLTADRPAEHSLNHVFGELPSAHQQRKS